MVLWCFGDEYWWTFSDFQWVPKQKEWLFNVSLLLGSYAGLIIVKKWKVSSTLVIPTGTYRWCFVGVHLWQKIGDAYSLHRSMCKAFVFLFLRGALIQSILVGYCTGKHLEFPSVRARDVELQETLWEMDGFVTAERVHASPFPIRSHLVISITVRWSGLLSAVEITLVFFGGYLFILGEKNYP